MEEHSDEAISTNIIGQASRLSLSNKINIK